jgi:hypothetical protein
VVQEIPWRYGIDVRDGWYDGRDQPEGEKSPAWRGGDPTPDVGGVPRRSNPLRVYHLVVDLDHPGRMIEALGFSSSATAPQPEAQHLSGPFLLAATLE